MEATKINLQKWLFQIMLLGYSLRLHRNTEPKCKHGSVDHSGVLWDVCES